MDTIVSGMRPTGRLHLGHLHGALENWLRLQENYRCYFFVADWHALTTDYASPQGIKQSTIEMVTDWLSVGLDPNHSTIFRQSRVKEHAELHLLFSMITPVPWLERNPTYKDQLKELTDKDLSTYGFLGYPVLQAADVRRTDPGEPEICPAFQLHKIYCTPEEIDYVSQGCRTAGIGCLDCKKIMIKHVIADLAPFRERRASYEKNPGQVEAVLETGNEIAREKAAATMAEVREAVGL